METEMRVMQSAKNTYDAQEKLRLLQTQFSETLQSLTAKKNDNAGEIDASQREAIALLAASNKNLEDRITKDEDTIYQMTRSVSDTPERLLALPLLKKDMDALQEKSEDNLKAVRADVDRIYDLDKWLVALIGAAVLSGAMSNMFTHKREQHSLH